MVKESWEHIKINQEIAEGASTGQMQDNWGSKINNNSTGLEPIE